MSVILSERLVSRNRTLLSHLKSPVVSWPYMCWISFSTCLFYCSPSLFVVGSFYLHFSFLCHLFSTSLKIRLLVLESRVHSTALADLQTMELLTAHAEILVSRFTDQCVAVMGNLTSASAFFKVTLVVCVNESPRSTMDTVVSPFVFSASFLSFLLLFPAFL